MNLPANKSAWLEREPDLVPRAGIAALLGVVLFVAATFIRASAGDTDIDNDVQLLEHYRENSGTLLLSTIVGGLGWLCFGAALYVLFRAAWARSARIKGTMVAFAFIGPVLLAIQGPVQTIALKNAGDTFVEEAPASAQSTTTDAEVTTTPTEEEQPTTTDSADEDSDDEKDPEEQRAEDTIDDSGLSQFARALLFPALIGLGIGMVYISIWASRTGLMTRFWGSLGAAIGVLVVLVPPMGQLAIVLWFVVLGMLLVGRWPGGRPPAWEAGKAIPWLRPGEEPPDESGDVEGQGREITPPPGEGDDSPAEGNGADPRGNGPPPRKRKRRG